MNSDTFLQIPLTSPKLPSKQSVTGQCEHTLRIRNLLYSSLMLPQSSDIPLNATSSSISSSTGRVLLPYIAPHPEKGTPYHRYSFLLFRQPAKDAPSSTKMLQQHGDRFSVRDFAKQWNLHPVGVTFFRQVWSREVKDVFEKDLSECLSVH